MHVLGTAGHVDHGKSAFLRVLTSMEPDRLPDEKKTGMTIDLNFVWFQPEKGDRIGIVDVPGHKRFVKNMISGVMNIDAFIFIVAADDGWMPQSQEHLEVLTSMSISNGIAILTKADLVSSERIAGVEQDLQIRFERAFGKSIPICQFSAPKPENIGDIRAKIEQMVEGLPNAEDNDAARVWVDRVFTPKGLGPVVTGTLREGTLKVGQEVRVLPENLSATVRSLQSYKSDLQEAKPVSRVAVQLSKVDGTKLSRGCLIQAGKNIPTTTVFDASVRFFRKLAGKTLELPIHVGTDRVLCVVIPMGETQAERGFVRVKPKEPVALRAGDRFLIRTPGEEINCGGGIVIDPRPSIRTHKKALEFLRSWAPTPEGQIAFSLAVSPVIDLEQLWNTSCYSRAQLNEVLKGSEFVSLGDGKFARKDRWEEVKQTVEKVLEVFHKGKHDTVAPTDLLKGIQVQLKLAPELLDVIVKALVNEGRVQRVAQGLRLAKFKQVLEPWEQTIVKQMDQIFEQTGKPIQLKDFGNETKKIKPLLQKLVKQGRLIGLADEHFVDAKLYDSWKSKVASHLQAKTQATTSELRTLLNTSRKYAVLLLERMDRDRLTFLKDGVRKLLK